MNQSTTLYRYLFIK